MGSTWSPFGTDDLLVAAADGAPGSGDAATGRLAGQGQGEAEFGKDGPTLFRVRPVSAHQAQGLCGRTCLAVLRGLGGHSAAVAQDGTALWTAPTEKADVQKRLVMLRKRQSTTAVRRRGVRRCPGWSRRPWRSS